MTATLRAGRARATITPPLGSRLQGSISRDQPAWRVMDDLYLKLLLLECDGIRHAIYTCDLIEFSRDFIAHVRGTLESRSGIPGPNVMFCASHTHTGPPTIPLQDVDPDPDYMSQLAGHMVGLMVSAERSFTDVTVSVGSGEAQGVGINRRRPTSRGIRQLPYPQGVTDPSVQVLRFDTTDGLPFVFLVNFSTHPTTLGIHVCEVSADYPGRMQRIVEAVYGDTMVMFVQGACGDVKAAALAEDGNFKEGEEEDIERLGRILAGEVVKTAERTNPIGNPAVRSIQKDVRFPYRNLPSTSDYEELIGFHSEELARWKAPSEATARGADWEDAHINRALMHESMVNWARRMRDASSRGELSKWATGEVQILQFGDQTALVGIPGELFSEIGLSLKQQSPVPHTMICGYANGTLGYIPSGKAIAEGGYEVTDAYKLYGFPDCFHGDTEGILFREVGALLNALKQ